MSKNRTTRFVFNYFGWFATNEYKIDTIGYLFMNIGVELSLSFIISPDALFGPTTEVTRLIWA